MKTCQPGDSETEEGRRRLKRRRRRLCPAPAAPSSWRRRSGVRELGRISSTFCRKIHQNPTKPNKALFLILKILVDYEGKSFESCAFSGFHGIIFVALHSLGQRPRNVFLGRKEIHPTSFVFLVQKCQARLFKRQTDRVSLLPAFKFWKIHSKKNLDFRISSLQNAWIPRWNFSS